MYAEYFQLKQPPFSIVPSSTGCVMFPSMDEAFKRLCQGVDDASGPVLVIGPSGCSKSTLLALAKEKYGNQMRVISLYCAAIASRQELIQCLMFELGLPYQSTDVGELRLNLIDHLKSTDQCPQGLLLLVDEAHNLSHEVLEELRMITNLVIGGKHRVQLVIAGGRPLEEKLGHPQLETFNQRIGVRCYLHPMSLDETVSFVLTKINLSGRDGREIFQPTSLQKIYDITEGVPRLVVQLCNHVLNMACSAGRQTIDQTLVQHAWCDLQQLPIPGANQSADSLIEDSPSDVIEFGNLDDHVSDADDRSLPHQAVSVDGPDAGAEPCTANCTEDQFSETSDTKPTTRHDSTRSGKEWAEPDAQLDDLLKQLKSIPEIQLNENESTSENLESSGLTENTADRQAIASLRQADISGSEISSPTTPSASELFGGQFENEETVVDLYSEETSRHNVSSAELTTPDLVDLKPIDLAANEQTLAELPEVQNSRCPAPAAPDLPEKSADTSVPADHAEPFASMTTQTDTYQTNTLAEPILSGHAEIDEIVAVPQEVDLPHSRQTEAEEEIPIPPSTGQVIRMDYRDLFDQLKSDNPPQTEQ